ncbi:hypothetical protein [Pseudomaricurvus sp.]|uniref:hypothetical protein n=1 Tax=Pseudomaricurvus sp. TaxID=2004510 RepID=UPI003F6BA6CF
MVNVVSHIAAKTDVKAAMKSAVCGLLLLLCVGGGFIEAETSRYERTILALQTAPQEWRSDFALIALSQLADAYYAEADLARSPLSRSGNSDQKRNSDSEKNTEWSWSVERYANQLYGFQMSVESGAQVAVEKSSVTEAVLEVGSQQVMLSHPRPEKQSAFEQTILRRFCQLRDCVALTGIYDLQSSIPQTGQGIGQKETAESSREEVKPSWMFTVDGPVCSYEGIRMTFSPGDNPGAVRHLCVQLFGELKAVLRGIQEQQAYGVRVAWPDMTTIQSSDQRKHLISLNEAGDLLDLNVPLLNSKPDLLGYLKPWMRAHLEGHGVSLELSAKSMGWQGAALDQFR